MCWSCWFLNFLQSLAQGLGSGYPLFLLLSGRWGGIFEMQVQSFLQEHTASHNFRCLVKIQETASLVALYQGLSAALRLNSLITHHYGEQRVSQKPAVSEGKSQPLLGSSQHSSSLLHQPAGERVVHRKIPDFLESFCAQKLPDWFSPTLLTQV